ncbi:HdeD family acid-resistance protein [Methanoplanus endosymbiosus]|uniref:Uncharacterized protein n=1 Tax=Methanoplanus endosymbiosus TaxID=33865 RepID=A0A9E7PRH8_9EURY|nr:hypothetical protein [Methanoplanus endosymbiosus]UUX93681.1 hypothetical protein L6E24_06075 [Methanoplanus endosymbiosus]
MTRLDDFLQPLSQGVWEVEIPKEKVTEPLGAEWLKSDINVPSPETIASYRKGRFHVHETEGEWRVHLDRYDPKKNPILHLIDDAPLLLMIGDTFITLISDIRRKEFKDTKKVLQEQKREWHLSVFAGIFLLLFGFHIILNPLNIFRGVFGFIIPAAISVVGLLMIIAPFRAKNSESFTWTDVFRGVAVLIAGIVSFDLSLQLWVTVLMAVLGLWMLASALMLLMRVKKGRSAVPEGFISRMIIAVISLPLSVYMFVEPATIIGILLITLGLITSLIGLLLFVNGIRLWRVMKRQISS